MLKSIRIIKKSAVLLLLISFLYPNFILSYTLYRCGDNVSEESCCCGNSKDNTPTTIQFQKRDCCDIEKINSRPAPEASNPGIKLLIAHFNYFQFTELFSSNNPLSEPQYTITSPPRNTPAKPFISTTVLRI
jgi:hypothetical protein